MGGHKCKKREWDEVRRDVGGERKHTNQGKGPSPLKTRDATSFSL
jgi:hypothetical protein